MTHPQSRDANRQWIFIHDSTNTLNHEWATSPAAPTVTTRSAMHTTRARRPIKGNGSPERRGESSARTAILNLSTPRQGPLTWTGDFKATCPRGQRLTGRPQVLKFV